MMLRYFATSERPSRRGRLLKSIDVLEVSGQSVSIVMALWIVETDGGLAV